MPKSCIQNLSDFKKGFKTYLKFQKLLIMKKPREWYIIMLYLISHWVV